MVAPAVETFLFDGVAVSPCVVLSSALGAYLVVSWFGAVGSCVGVDCVASEAVCQFHILFLLNLMRRNSGVEHFDSGL